MADISLREYLDNVEAVLSSGTNDQVLHHCRHILRYFPKNVAAYRYLGQALLRGSNLDEAGEIFRRVLSVFPDDYTAHLGLSEINERQGKGNEALWHLERAFEQDPNNPKITEKLRELNRRFRQIDQSRFQLTSGAVARQYLRSGLYDQALETLQTTLEKSPRRADLRLLLAKAMWAAGLEVEAAENALEVLKLLPDSLEANEILTRLWLAEGRPSDAQRYLSRVESVDPYAALAIAQGGPPPADAFTLPELDYGAIARQRVQTKQPDWLDDIDAQPQQNDWMSGLGAAGAAAIATDSDEVPPDWLTNDETAADAAPLDDLFGGMDDDPFELSDADFDSSGSGLTGLLDSLEREDQTASAQPAGIFDSGDADDDMPTFDFNDDELPQSGWLTDTSEESAVDEDDPLAWLQAESTAEDDESLDWMQSAGDLDSPDMPVLPDSGSLLRGTDDDDPLAWMQSSGVEISDPNARREPRFSLDSEGDMTFQDPDEVNPFAWMQTSGVELEGEAAPDFFTDLADVPAESAVDDDDPLSWMRESGIDIDEDTPAPVDLPSMSSLLDAPQSAAGDDSWFNDEDLLDEMLDIEELTQTGSLSGTGSLNMDAVESDPMDSAADWLDDTFASEPQTTGDAFPQATDWQNDMSDPNDNNLPDWLSSESSSDSSDEEDAFGWLNEEPATDEPDDDSALDWMVEVPEESAEGDSFEWLAGDAEAEAEPVSQTPDWLAGVAPVSEFETDDESAEGDSFEWLAGDAEEEEAQPVSETPDWLSGVAPVSEFETDDESAEGDSFEWLAGDAEEEAQPVSATPDWLAGVAPVSELETDDESAEGDSFEWLSGDAEEAQAKPVSETPDWLSSVAPISEFATDDESAEGDSFEWLAGDAEEVAEPVSETPDWLTGVAPVSEFETDDESAEGDSFEWLAGDAEEEAEPVSETPDWLAGVAPVSEFETDDESAEGDSFEWLAGDAEEAEAEPVNETPDWLSSVAPVSEFETDDESAEGDSFEWLAGDAEEAEAEPVSETPDWLNSVAPVSEFETDEESAEGDSFEWLAGDAKEEEAQPVSETLNWLSSDAPISEFETDDEASEGDSFEWLAGDAKDEAEPVNETPDWLAEVASASEFESESEDEEALIGDSFEWLASDAEEEEDVEPVSETPDWLSAAAPAVDFITESDNPVPDNQFDWLPEDDAEAAAERNQLEWLSDEDAEPAAEPAVPTPAYEWLDIDQEAEAESSPLEWLDAGEEALDEDVPAAEPVSETPYWLSEAVPAAELAGDEDEPQSDSFTWEVEQEPDWLAEIPVASDETDDDEAAVADDVPLWLAEAGPVARQTEPDESDWESDGVLAYDTDPAESEFGWLGDTDPAESDEPYMPDYEPAEAYAADSDLDYGDDEDEKLLAAAQKPEPAENAPSWLNEMVPGLDLEYDAPEDAPIETEFVESAPVEDTSEFAVNPQKSKDFNWLVDIVDEETSQFEPVPEAETAPADRPAGRRRFSFRQLPKWLRRNGGQAEQPANDDPDFELPDWLR